jgi:ribosome biogenesis GTPase
MLVIEFEQLSALGLTPALANRAAGMVVADGAAPVSAAGDGADASAGGKAHEMLRITTVHRSTVGVHDGHGERIARVLPRLTRALQEEGTALAVGDWVLATSDAFEETWIEARVPPSSHIARRDGDGRVHTLVSNVDTALLVMGLDDDFNPRRLERYLALVRGDGITPVVVLTKVDVATPTPAALDARLRHLEGRVPVGVDLLAVNATDPSAARALGAYLARGQTLVLLGSSGAGKSTLTNTLLGAHVQDTGAVRENDGRGKHTTTSRSLHRLPGGACVIDTPGLRTLRPDADEASLAAAYEDIGALAAQCRFRDCRHAEEPGCAVREGIGPDRLRNYHKMLREMRRDSLTALDRQRQVSEWKARGRAAKVRMKAKRGE